jgi:hypothetical protein
MKGWFFCIKNKKHLYEEELVYITMDRNCKEIKKKIKNIRVKFMKTKEKIEKLEKEIFKNEMEIQHIQSISPQEYLSDLSKHNEKILLGVIRESQEGTNCTSLNTSNEQNKN